MKPMFKRLLAGALLLGMPAVSQAEPVQLQMLTSAGEITLELYPEKAPKTVDNFLRYVNEGSYRRTVFHRVIPGFVIQGGGFDDQGAKRPTHAPVVNESANGLSNRPGSIAMARTSAPDSATNQFYFNLADNGFLDGRAGKAGYTVFGQVIEGMSVLQRIASVPTHRDPNTRMPDVPVRPIYLDQIEVIAGKAAEQVTSEQESTKQKVINQEGIE